MLASVITPEPILPWDTLQEVRIDLSLVLLFIDLVSALPGWNAASDFLLACYPILLFWSLQISKTMKFGLCGLLGLGAFAAICSAIKTWQIHAIDNTEDPASISVRLL